MTRLLGLPFLAVALLFGYEWGALTFGLPTLSQMVSAHAFRRRAAVVAAVRAHGQRAIEEEPS